FTFSRDGRYVALPSSVILRGFSDKVGAQGKLIIHGWLGLLPEHLRYTLRNTRTGEIVEEDNLHVLPTPDANTRFFFVTVPANIGSEPLSLTVEAPPFLRRTVLLSEFLGRWTIPQPVVLLAGDIDGDNEVSLLDFSRLLAAFGSFAGEEQYDVDADLDGDGEISLWDLSWLLLHFGMAGDE
ncbi:MAG: dockerin type I domain-containing protein, partial [Armatimonadota bacterium]|nr:dockerin type I domain-containing protein [Armatimonadota bacterium]